MTSTPDDAPAPNSLTESVPGDVMVLSDDFRVGLDHPTTDAKLDVLEELPAFLDDLHELLRPYKKYAEGDTGRDPYDAALGDFLKTWKDTALITTKE